MTNDYKIIFFGTPEFSTIILKKMIENEYTPMAVVTAPDKPVGRRQILTPSPVKLLAEKNKIQALQPKKILDSRLKIKDLRPDLIVLVAFGQIIPKEILEIPKYGCLNVHPSLLPKYRGASPIQTAILNGDKETGVTIMLMDENLDQGSIISNDKLLIAINETTETLTIKLAKLGRNLLIETLPKWVNEEIKAQPQDHSKATFTREIKKDDGKIDWHKSAEEIERMIRAFNPWPTTYTEYRTKNAEYRKLKIIKASLLKTENKKESGMIFSTLDKKLAVACNNNALFLEKIQLEGKKVMTAQEFLNGHPEIIDLKLK